METTASQSLAGCPPIRGPLSGRYRTGLPVGLLFLLPASLTADTVYLKDGGFIKNCRILREDRTTVHLRAPAGPMGVPKEIVRRTVKQKSIFDTYDKLRKKVREDSPTSLYKLATWCRKNAGFREEMRELLARVLKLDGEHVMARRLLGYLRIDDAWQRAPLLHTVTQIKVPKKLTTVRETLEKNLGAIAEWRQDTRLVKDLRSIAPLHGCKLTASVEIRGCYGPQFYGRRLGGARTLSRVVLKVKGGWLGTKGRKLEFGGQAPASVEDSPSAAVSAAFVTNAIMIHEFLDAIHDSRMKKLEAEVRKKALAEARQGKKTSP